MNRHSARLYGNRSTPPEKRCTAPMAMRIAPGQEHQEGSLFHADPGIVGKSTNINSAPYTVLGVLPRKVAKIGDEELYIPLVFEPPLATERGLRDISTVGRLAPQLTFAAAQSRMRDRMRQPYRPRQ